MEFIGIKKKFRPKKVRVSLQAVDKDTSNFAHLKQVNS